MRDLENTLAHFTGSETIHRWSALYPRFYLTDGAKYLADEAGAYWLMDIIGSYQPNLFRKEEWFQVWTIRKTGSSAVVSCDDGNGNVLVTQEIEYTDFPLAECKLYASYAEGNTLIILLPTEY